MSTPPLSYDLSLFRRIAEGDEQAFYLFYKEYRQQLKGFALELTKSATDAEDVLQETFMRIWLARDKMVEIDNPRAWVFTINARVCLHWLRRRANHQKKIDHIIVPENDSETPFDTTHYKEIHGIIQEKVRSMPEQRRRIFTMSRDRGMKPAQIAEELGLSGGTVRNVLMTAVREIREALSERGFVVSFFLLYFPDIIFLSKNL
ncbi:MAG: RNA polymerase sigma factor [Sediminibacterium sp.]